MFNISSRCEIFGYTDWARQIWSRIIRIEKQTKQIAHIYPNIHHSRFLSLSDLALLREKLSTRTPNYIKFYIPRRSDGPIFVTNHVVYY